MSSYLVSDSFKSQNLYNSLTDRCIFPSATAAVYKISLHDKSAVAEEAYFRRGGGFHFYTQVMRDAINGDFVTDFRKGGPSLFYLLTRN